MNRLKKEINFSLWCDFIERDFLEDGFKHLLEKKLILGATSNPDIFKNAIINSDAYTQQIDMLQANSAKKIYEELSSIDIKRAASLLKPLYEANDEDGFISLEVDPNLCDDTQATIQEGIRLYHQINTDNLMIKIPATPAGYEAMRELTSLGIAVNATLIFSPSQAKQCAKALDDGIKQSGKDTKAVISVFVSRLDRLLAKTKLGIINATKCYFEVEKFNNKNLRTLFASTGVKDDSLPPSYYIDNLIFPNSINTAPLNAIGAWEEDGKKEPSTIISEDECDIYLANLEDENIDINDAYEKLLKDGLSAFRVSFEQLLKKVKL